MAKSPDYRKAYEAAKAELSELLADEQRTAKRLIVVRKSIQTLAALCEEQGIEVDASEDAEALVAHSTLADEIRTILRSQYPAWTRPHWIRAEIERLGHDLSNYTNAQASIQMVVKRMVESGEVEEQTSEEGKKEYRWIQILPSFLRSANAIRDSILLETLTAERERTPKAPIPPASMRKKLGLDKS